MPSIRDKTVSTGDDSHPPRAERAVELGHYLRQATITLRRHSPWLNHAWCKHRHPLTNEIAWKH